MRCVSRCSFGSNGGVITWQRGSAEQHTETGEKSVGISVLAGRGHADLVDGRSRSSHSDRVGRRGSGPTALVAKYQDSCLPSGPLAGPYFSEAAHRDRATT